MIITTYSYSLMPVEWIFGISKKILAYQNKIKATSFSKNYGKWLSNIHKNELIMRKESKFACSKKTSRKLFQ